MGNLLAMKNILLILLFVGFRSFAQTDTLVHISVNNDFNYNCTTCPDSVFISVDSVFVYSNVTVYDTTGVYQDTEIFRVTTSTYDIADPAIYVYDGTVSSIFKLPTGTDEISGREYLVANKGAGKVLIEKNDGTDLIILDVGMVFNLIWDKINWIIY